MSSETFYRMIQRTCTNGPLNPAEMQHEIDSIDYIMHQRENYSEDAMTAYDRHYLLKKLWGGISFPYFFGITS